MPEATFAAGRYGCAQDTGNLPSRSGFRSRLTPAAAVRSDIIRYTTESETRHEDSTMKPHLLSSLAIAIVGVGMTAATGRSADEGWVSLFDGNTLDGWTLRGGSATFKVEDGTIVGTTASGGPNTFLCRGPYGDFVLEFEVRCDIPLNSGVQIRSHVYEKDTPQESAPNRVRKAGEVYGYQCEIADQSLGTAGNFWDEARRTKWLDDFSDKPEARSAFKNRVWNHFRIVAQGPRIRSYINGIPCADFQDDRDSSGFIGLQVHSIKPGTGPYQVRWRNIRLRELKPGETP
jgi:hypothetical protein